MAAYPVPTAECDHCDHRFVLEPDAMFTDSLDVSYWLCRPCRSLYENIPGYGWGELPESFD